MPDYPFTVRWQLSSYTPDYDHPPPFPLYWMREQSGTLRRIVGKYVIDDPLTRYELDVMRWYVWQFCRALPFPPPDLALVKTMTQKELRAYVHGTLLDHGIDPL